MSSAAVVVAERAARGRHGASTSAGRGRGTGTGWKGLQPVRPAAAVAAAGFLLVVAGYGWVLTRAMHATDLAVYRGAAGAALRHGSVYGATYTANRLLFTYPPSGLLAVAWTALGPWPVVVAVSVAANVAALAVTCTVCLAVPPRSPTGTRAGIPRRWLPVVVTVAGGLAAEPVWRTVGFGQVNLLLMAMVVVDVTVVPRRYRGVLTGLATAVKLTPAVFVLYFAATRQVRPVLVAGATAALAAVAAAAAFPGPSRWYWTSLVFRNRTGGAAIVGNQSLHGALLRLGVHGLGPLLTAIAVVVALGYAGVRRCVRRGELGTAVAVTAVTGLLVSPVSWSHHWVWVVPLTVCAYREHTARSVRAAVTVLAAATVLAPGLWWVDRRPGDGLPTVLQLTVSDAYVVAAVLVLLAAAGARTLQSVRDITGDPDPATGANPDVVPVASTSAPGYRPDQRRDGSMGCR